MAKMESLSARLKQDSLENLQTSISALTLSDERAPTQLPTASPVPTPAYPQSVNRNHPQSYQPSSSSSAQTMRPLPPTAPIDLPSSLADSSLLPSRQSRSSPQILLAEERALLDLQHVNAELDHLRITFSPTGSLQFKRNPTGPFAHSTSFNASNSGPHALTSATINASFLAQERAVVSMHLMLQDPANFPPSVENVRFSILSRTEGHLRSLESYKEQEWLRQVWLGKPREDGEPYIIDTGQKITHLPSPPLYLLPS